MRAPCFKCGPTTNGMMRNWWWMPYVEIMMFGPDQRGMMRMRLRPGGVRSQEILISSIILDRLDPLKVTCMTTELATGIGTGSASSFLSVTSNCTWNHAKTNSFSVSFFFLIVCFNFNFFVFDFPSVNSRAEGLQGHLTTWHFSYRNGHWPRCRTLSMQDVNYYPLRPCFYQPGIHPSSTALLPPPPWIHWQSIHSHVSTSDGA